MGGGGREVDAAIRRMHWISGSKTGNRGHPDRPMSIQALPQSCTRVWPAGDHSPNTATASLPTINNNVDGDRDGDDDGDGDDDDYSTATLWRNDHDDFFALPKHVRCRASNSSYLRFRRASVQPFPGD
eukprot:7495914-Pyramimonas_sp.AAC.1